MKVVILAGGFGTRLEEETVNIPKPLVRIGDYPILWHIMKIYSHFGYHDFIVCLGYKGYLIKEYFANYFLHHSDVTFDYTNGKQETIIHSKTVEPWKVTLVDTGQQTQTGGRIKRIEPYINQEPFMLTYGDTLAAIDISALVQTHQAHKRVATLTAVQPPGKWGALQLGKSAQVTHFDEKPAGDGGWINGGFFVLSPDIFSYLKDGDETVWERAPLEQLARDGQLSVYTHQDFWQCMDTQRNKNELNKLWRSPNPPWKVWDTPQPSPQDVYELQP